MADNEVTRDNNDQGRDTVVVKEQHSSGIGWIIFAVIALAILFLLFMVNPFAGNGSDADVNVDVPAPSVNVPNPEDATQ